MRIFPLREYYACISCLRASRVCALPSWIQRTARIRALLKAFASGESFAAPAGPFRPTLRRLLLFLQLLRRYSSFALFALCGFGQYLSLLTSLDAVIIQQPQLLSGVRKEVSAHTLTGQANSGVYVRLCILSRGIISLDVIHSRTSLLGHPFCGT